MFRVTVKTQAVRGELRYHLRLDSTRGGERRICGVLELDPQEWVAFLSIAEHEHIPIEVTHETVPAAPAVTAAAE